MSIAFPRFAVALAPLLSSAAHAQTLGGGQSFEPPVLRLAIGLLLCSLLAIVAAMMIKHFTHGGVRLKSNSSLASLLRLPARKLRVVESQRISPHADLFLVVCDGRQYLIIASSGAATVLREDIVSEPGATT